MTCSPEADQGTAPRVRVPETERVLLPGVCSLSEGPPRKGRILLIHILDLPSLCSHDGIWWFSLSLSGHFAFFFFFFLNSALPHTLSFFSFSLLPFWGMCLSHHTRLEKSKKKEKGKGIIYRPCSTVQYGVLPVCLFFNLVLVLPLSGSIST